MITVDLMIHQEEEAMMTMDIQIQEQTEIAMIDIDCIIM